MKKTREMNQVYIYARKGSKIRDMIAINEKRNQPAPAANATQAMSSPVIICDHAFVCIYFHLLSTICHVHRSDE